MFQSGHQNISYRGTVCGDGGGWKSPWTLQAARGGDWDDRHLHGPPPGAERRHLVLQGRRVEAVRIQPRFSGRRRDTCRGGAVPQDCRHGGRPRLRDVRSTNRPGSKSRQFLLVRGQLQTSPQELLPTCAPRLFQSWQNVHCCQASLKKYLQISCFMHRWKDMLE